MRVSPYFLSSTLTPSQMCRRSTVCPRRSDAALGRGRRSRPNADHRHVPEFPVAPERGHTREVVDINRNALWHDTAGVAPAASLEALYRVQLRKLEPVGFVYLWREGMA